MVVARALLQRNAEARVEYNAGKQSPKDLIEVVVQTAVRNFVPIGQM